MASHKFTVTMAAEAAGVTPRAVRLYEAKGLIGPADRAANGYRIFDEDDVERLRFVRRARTLGLSLAAAAEILDTAAQGEPPCEQACDLLDQRVAEIDAAIDELQRLRASIVSARQYPVRRDGCDATWCPVIEQA